MYRICISIIKFTINFENCCLNIAKHLLWNGKKVRKEKKICVYKLGNIGDLICAIPALYKIREKYPNSIITVLNCPGKKGNIGADIVLTCLDWIDEIKIYNSEDIRGIKNILSFLKSFKLESFDYLIQLPAEKTTFFTQIRNMLFFKLTNVECAEGFYVSTIKLFKKQQLLYLKNKCEVERLIDGLPFETNRNVDFKITILDEDKIYVEHKLYKYNILTEDNIMMISPFAKASCNIWENNRFKEIADRWTANGGVVIVIGGEKEIGDRFCNYENTKIINLCGVFTLNQSMYLLTKAKFLLTLDTGTAHMAAAMGVPMITIMSSCYFEEKWKAYGRNKIFRKNLGCSPCLKKTCKYGDNRCINSITVDDVWYYIEKVYLK